LLKPFCLILIWGISSAYAQDEDLNALETAIMEDVSDGRPSPRSRNPLAPRNTSQTSPSAAPEDMGRALDLRSVLEEGFRRNPFEQMRQQRKEQLSLSKIDLKQSFWLPTVSLQMQTGNHLIDRFRSSSQNVAGMGAQNAPSGSLGLVVDDYTIFNWGRDYLAYQNARDSLDRASVQLQEARRRLKFALIGQYFNLLRFKQFIKITQEQVRQTSFVHRIAREKLQLRKIRPQEYYQTRSEYLRAQTEYQQARFDVGIEEERMANLLGDDYRGTYRSIEQLKFTTLNTTMEEALRLAQEQSVEYRDAKLAYDNASRSYEQALKENLPLPRFGLNLGSYRTGFDPDGTSWNYQTTPGNRNVELVAAINMRWTLLGEGGLFNSRINQQAFLSKRISEINFFNTRRELDVRIRTIYKTLRFLEQKVEIALHQHRNAQSNYDSVLDNYTAGNASYADIKLAIDNLVLSQINSENQKYEHLLRKLELADFMGLEDLPGDNFEALAVR
jgi:outer membrane protein TolC